MFNQTRRDADHSSSVTRRFTGIVGRLAQICANLSAYFFARLCYVRSNICYVVAFAICYGIAKTRSNHTPGIATQLIEHGVLRNLRINRPQQRPPTRSLRGLRNWKHKAGLRGMRKRRQKVKRGKQYRTEKKQQGGTGANQYTVEQSGQVSGKTDHSAKTADRIALASGVKPITVRRDADYSEAIDVLVADSAPIATRSLILSSVSVSRPGDKTLHQDAKNPPPDKPMMG